MLNNEQFEDGRKKVTSENTTFKLAQSYGKYTTNSLSKGSCFIGWRGVATLKLKGINII